MKVWISKLPKMLLRGSVIGFGGVDFAWVKPKVVLFPAVPNSSLPLGPLGNPTDAKILRRRTVCASAVPLVFRVRANPQVGSAIIQAVAIDVIDD